MFEPKKVHVQYRIESQESGVREFDFRLDESGLLENMPDEGPEWTLLDGERCQGCTSPSRHCQAALAITPVVEAFHSLDSLQCVRTRASINGRVTEVTGPVTQAVSSMMGLCMAASGCVATAPFRAMAIHHRPFATLEETVIRAASFTLLWQWARGRFNQENPFAELLEAWANLEEVNQRIGRKLQTYCLNDATVNGLVGLDMFAKGGAIGLESALNALKPALLAHPEAAAGC